MNIHHCPYCDFDAFENEAVQEGNDWLNRCLSCHQWSKFIMETGAQTELPVERRDNP